MRATTRSTPKVSRATRAAMMLELSPLETAAKASARSMPASVRVSRSKPMPFGLSGKFLPETDEGGRVLVDDGNRVVAPGEAARQRRSDPATAQDDDVHGAPVCSNGSMGGHL